MEVAFEWLGLTYLVHPSLGLLYMVCLFFKQICTFVVVLSDNL